MSAFGCDEARQWAEARSAGSLGDDEAAALDVHLAICADCRETLDLLDAIASTLRDTPLPALTAGEEARFLSGDRAGPARSGAAWPAVAALAAAVVLGLALWTAPDEPGPAPVVEVAPTVVPDPPAVVQAPPPDHVPGSAEGTGLYLTTDGRVTTRSNDGREAWHVLEQGTAVAVVGDNEPGFRFRVETPRSLVTATGTIFSVQVFADGRERYRVLEGSVEVLAKEEGAVPTALHAGFELASDAAEPQRSAAATMRADLKLARWQPSAASAYVDEVARRLDLEASTPAPVKAPVVVRAAEAARSLDELYRLARRHQLAREFEEASAVHEEIVRTHPDERGAWVSHVALGQMRLQAGQATASLRHFDRYLQLAPAGSLAEEARFGRVGASRELARHADVVTLASEYLERHPDSVGGAEVLRARADALRASQQWARADADYQAIIARWPDTSQATHARVALEASADAP